MIPPLVTQSTPDPRRSPVDGGSADIGQGYTDERVRGRDNHGRHNAPGRNEPAELAAPAALTQKWPALTSLEGMPACNVGRAYAAFAADIGTGTHTVPDFADADRRHEVITAIDGSAASGERVKA
jgi:predicted dehydrogenase